MVKITSTGTHAAHVPSQGANQKTGDVLEVGAAVAAASSEPSPPPVTLDSEAEAIKKHLKRLDTKQLPQEIKRLFVGWFDEKPNLKDLAKKTGALKLSAAYEALQDIKIKELNKHLKNKGASPAEWHELFQGNSGILDLMDKAAKEMGGFESGLYHGKGRFEYADGNVYEGDFVFGKRQGQGKMAYANGHKYQGEWKAGNKEGHGIYTLKDGSKYDGKWKADKREGQGTLTLVSGITYAGAWEDNKKEGHGIYTWPNGEKYDGEWRADRRDGIGTIFYANGESVRGHFENEKLSDKPVIWQHPDGWKYEGQFANSRFEPAGKWTLKDGSEYKGRFIDHQPEALFVRRLEDTPAAFFHRESQNSAELIKKYQETTQKINSVLEQSNPDEAGKQLEDLWKYHSQPNGSPAETLIQIVAHTPPGLAKAPQFMEQVLWRLAKKHKIHENVNLEQYASFEAESLKSSARRYANSSQQAWAVWMHLMTLEAVNMLKKPSVKFDILFQALGAMRYIQACATNNLTREPLNDFGCKRLSGLYTKHEPKDQRYGPFGLYLHEQNKATQIDLSKPYHIWAQAKDGTTAIGTKITAQTWHHCSPETIPVVRKMFEEWTTYILQNNYQESPERLMADLAHWYHTSVQGTFYFRGSSAITQAMFVALCRVKGIEAPKFLDLLDCWALSMQVKDFKEQIFLPWFRKESIPLAQRYQKILWDPIGKKPNDNLSSILASPLTDSIFHQVEGLLRQGANQNQKINNWRSDNQDMSLIQFATHAVIPELANLLAQYGAEGIEKASIRSSHPVYADLNFAEVALCERKFELAKSLIAKGFTPRLEFKFPTGTTDQEETLNNVLKRKLFPEELKKLELILK